MGLMDDFMSSYVSPWGEYNEKQQKIIDKWKGMLKVDRLDMTPFRDVDFLEAFLRTIPEEEQFNYVQSTNNYHYRSGYKTLGEFNPNFVLVTRRAVPSDTPKPEQYWTEEHGTALLGLKKEIPPGSAQRMHSIIMVSTLQKLKSHGEPTDEEIGGGASDGEIMTSSEPFPSENFLFVYKPKKELEELALYIKNGGMSKEELVSKLKDNSEKRKNRNNSLYSLTTQDIGRATINSPTTLKQQAISIEQVQVSRKNEPENDDIW